MAFKVADKVRFQRDWIKTLYRNHGKDNCWAQDEAIGIIYTVYNQESLLVEWSSVRIVTDNQADGQYITDHMNPRHLELCPLLKIGNRFKNLIPLS